MVKNFLKIAGVKTQAEFYKKYPSEEAFFKAHPEAMQLVHQKMAYGGMYAYQDGGEPLSSDYPSFAQYKTDHDAWEASMSVPQIDPSTAAAYDMPAVGADGIPDYLRAPQTFVAPPAASEPAPVDPNAYSYLGAAPSASAATGTPIKLNDYQGGSVYDFLTAQGVSGDYNSRKGLAKTLGISGYKGLPEQNAQMMEMIRQNPDVLSGYTKAPTSGKRSTSKGSKKTDLSEYSEEEIAAARAARPDLFETDQPDVDTPIGLNDYLPQLGRGTSEKDRRIMERQAAKEFNEKKTGTFTLPNGKTKTYDQMNWKEKAYVVGKSLEGKGRFNEGDEAWYDKVNPLAWITGAAGALGEAPLQSEMAQSVRPMIDAIAAPIAAGAGVGLVNSAYNYFKPRYEPFTPPSRPSSTSSTPKQLPGSPSSARQLPNPPKQLPNPANRLIPNIKRNSLIYEKAVPRPLPRGFTMGKDQVRSPGYPMHKYGGAYSNVPQHAHPGTYADGYSGTSSGGQYFAEGGLFQGFREGMKDGSLPGLAANVLSMTGVGQLTNTQTPAKTGNLKEDLLKVINGYQAGGSYNPTSVDYGDTLPQFAMGYDVPTAMYGGGMAYGGDLHEYQQDGQVREKGYGCKGKSCTKTGEGIRKIGVRFGANDEGVGGNTSPMPMSNARITWDELQNYNSGNLEGRELKDYNKGMKVRTKQLQSQFPGLTEDQLRTAGADSARISRVMFNPLTNESDVPNWDKQKTPYDRAWFDFYRPMMNQPNRVTVPQILERQSQQPGGLPAYKQTVEGNYGRTKAAKGGPVYSNVTQYNHQQYVPAFDWMADGGTPCYNCGGMYDQGGMYPDGRAIVNRGPYEGRALVNAYAQGGLVKGSVHDISEQDVQHLINQGYKIEYV